MSIVGREEAKERIKRKLGTPKSDLVAVIGRRRIGKTYLINQVLEKEIIFHFSGLFKGSMPEHLERFGKALNEAQGNNNPITPLLSWFEAFDRLRMYINSKRSKKKKVIFLDEFPWMATNRSRFLTAFTDFWNSYAAKRTDLMVIICGSSASWMINKVLKNKGGLHNRVTERIILEPFTLGETKQLLVKNGVIIPDIEIITLYMAIGGVPYYIDQMQKGESSTQFIDRTCFRKNGVLRLEYDELFASLFDNSDKHHRIIEHLAAHPKGLTRIRLLQLAQLNSGGGATTILHELQTSGFIEEYIPYGKKKKDSLFKLKDHYVHFYLKYVKGSKEGQKNVWTKISNSPSFQSWSGLAFEQICHEHIDKIKEALKIDGILSTHGAWHTKGNDTITGAQIDLLIDRSDNIINLCEIKYSNSLYTITKDYAKVIRHKMAAFNYITKNKKGLFPTMITSYGLSDNMHAQDLIQQSVTADQLF